MFVFVAADTSSDSRPRPANAPTHEWPRSGAPAAYGHPAASAEVMSSIVIGVESVGPSGKPTPLPLYVAPSTAGTSQ
ncbi:unannotated protein [freshwater metagenome]|uniref:Unannotated protein n=1 Tax=freshwater metagenome TaxID=449393 RepID=A0A6J7REB3_9ZZZZ